MRFLFTTTYGTDDPTRAGIAVFNAKTAREDGHNAQMLFIGEAVSLFRPEVAASVKPVGFPVVSEAMEFFEENQVPIFA